MTLIVVESRRSESVTAFFADSRPNLNRNHGRKFQERKQCSVSDTPDTSATFSTDLASDRLKFLFYDSNIICSISSSGRHALFNPLLSLLSDSKNSPSPLPPPGKVLHRAPIISYKNYLARARATGVSKSRLTEQRFSLNVRRYSIFRRTL